MKHINHNESVGEEVSIQKETPVKKEMVIRINKNFLMSGILVVLVLVSGLQLVQLVMLQNALSGRSVKAAASTNIESGSANTGSSGSSVPSPSNIQNLPDMSGGC